MESIRNTMKIGGRELKTYFTSPVAYVFLVFFLVLVGFFTFAQYLGSYYESGEADLRRFFGWHPWLYLFLVPAASMRLWSEERRAGTMELLLTLPITLTQAIMGKFLAAWAFLILALALTFPIVPTTTLMLRGDLDGGAVFGGYLGSALMAGTYLSVGMLTSSMTRSQVISFVVSAAICLFLVLAGFPPVTAMLENWAPVWLTQGVASVSVMTHFESLQKGVLDTADLAYFVGIMVVMLVAAHVTLSGRSRT